jgi:hypothetical protein
MFFRINSLFSKSFIEIILFHESTTSLDSSYMGNANSSTISKRVSGVNLRSKTATISAAAYNGVIITIIPAAQTSYHQLSGWALGKSWFS